VVCFAVVQQWPLYTTLGLATRLILKYLLTAGKDIYSTTGVLNLQLDVLHGFPVNYTTSVHNRYYNSLAWTSDFGAVAIVSCI